MIFTYKKWNLFCKKLASQGVFSVSARDVFFVNKKYLVLKHDVETNVKKAYKIALIESKNGHIGSYYVQAYLLKDSKNIRLLQKMKDMGHEISYHYDVLDFAKGDIRLADEEYQKNLDLFNKSGFDIVTVCQHGNPIVERKGYTSNRDFFRNKEISSKYFSQSDIMVNFADKAKTRYKYYSDSGRKFKLIYDPFYNDVVDSEDKNVAFNNLDLLLCDIGDENAIISIHPHRWCRSAVLYVIKTSFFKAVRFFAKLLIKIPFMKKVFSKYYYLAKKI